MPPDGAKGAERTLAVVSSLPMDLDSFTEYCKQPGSERLVLRLEAAGATPGFAPSLVVCCVSGLCLTNTSPSVACACVRRDKTPLSPHADE